MQINIYLHISIFYLLQNKKNTLMQSGVSGRKFVSTGNLWYAFKGEIISTGQIGMKAATNTKKGVAGDDRNCNSGEQ